MGRCRCRVVVGGGLVVVVESARKMGRRGMRIRWDHRGRTRLMDHRDMLRMWVERFREGELAGVLQSRLRRTGSVGLIVVVVVESGVWRSLGMRASLGMRLVWCLCCSGGTSVMLYRS